MTPHTTPVRKYVGGGLADLADPTIPKAQVEVYLRSKDGETFYAPTLMEGILFLLSNQGFRLTVVEWPEGAGISRAEFGLRVYRCGQDLGVQIIAPMVDPAKGSISEVVLRDPPSLPDQPGTVEVVSLHQVLGIQPPPTDPDDLVEIVDVTIDGT